jgi:hypothetical protein
MSNTFEAMYEQFLSTHMNNRKGESLRRLKAGQGYAEKLF